MEWPEKRLARFFFTSLANDRAFGQVSFWKIQELVFADAEGPYIAARRRNNSLHQPKLALERQSLRGRQRLAVLVEHRKRLAAICAKPGIVVGIHRKAESAPLHPSAGEAVRGWGYGFSVRRKLGCVT